jgi:hypothetical protein
VGFESDFDVPPEEIAANRKRIAAENAAQGLIAGGWASLGVGALLTLVGTGTLIGARQSRFGLAGGITGTAVGGGLLITGSVLLALGYKKRKRVEAGDYSIAPTVGPTFAGLTFAGRW